LAVKIRLRRVGAKKQPSYRVVVADSRSPRDGRFIEVIGFYNPRTKPTTIQINEEKARKWLGNGALPTESVASLLFRAGIADLRSPRWRKEGDVLGAPATAAAPAPAPAQQAPAAVAEAAPVAAAPAEESPVVEVAPVAVAVAATPAEQTADGEPQSLPSEDSGAIVADTAVAGADTTTAS